MGVVTTKSITITDADLSPPLALSKGEGGPYRVKQVDARVSSVSGDSSTSKYKFFRVPSNVIVKTLQVATAALGGSCAADFGLYYADDVRYLAPGNSGNSGVVIDADFFKAAQTLVSALGLTDVTMGNVLATVSKFAQPLWQAAGLSTDPGGHFDIAATLTADSAASADLYARLTYVE